MPKRVLVTDKDIRMSIFFLTNLATILEFFKKNMLQNEDAGIIDLDYYERKMHNYEVVFDAVLDDFINEMFKSKSKSIRRELSETQKNELFVAVKILYIVKLSIF